MRAWPLFLLIGIIAGCSSTPVSLPSWDIPQATEKAQHPLELPVRPQATLSVTGMAEFSQEGMLQLQRYAAASEANYAIARANAQALEAQSRAYNALIQAGKLQRQVAEIRAELLEIERRDHFIDVWFYRGIIILGAVAMAL